MIRLTEEFGSQFRAARQVSTPLVAVRTADPASAAHLVTEAVHHGKQRPPILGWDVMRGLYAVGRDSDEELSRVLDGREALTVSPADALVIGQQFPEDALLLYANAHRFWNEPAIVQGIWNLRDPFKATGRMLVLITVPGAVLPPELA